MTINEPIDGSGYDILCAIVDLGRIRSRPAGDRSGLYDDAPHLRGVHARVWHPTGGTTPDRMAMLLHDVCFGDGTVPTMWRLVADAHAARLRAVRESQLGAAWAIGARCGRMLREQMEHEARDMNHNR